MRGRAWLAGGLAMVLRAVAAAALITAGARGLLHTGRDHGPPPPAQRGLRPQALAEELRRHARASYLHGVNDAVAFWRLTGVAPDAPAVRDALRARRQASPDALTAPEAQAIVRHATPRARAVKAAAAPSLNATFAAVACVGQRRLPADEPPPE
jgi:hypothetical protein